MERIWIDAIEDKRIVASFSVRQNHYVLADSIYPTAKPKEGSFLTVQRVWDKIEPDGALLPFYITFTLDQQIDTYSRKMLTLLEVSGFVGGIFEIFNVCVGFFMGIFSNFFLNRSVYKSISFEDNHYQEEAERLEN